MDEPLAGLFLYSSDKIIECKIVFFLPDSFWTNPQFRVTIDKLTSDCSVGPDEKNMLVSLMQKPDKRNRRLVQNLHIGFSVFEVSITFYCFCVRTIIGMSCKDMGSSCFVVFVVRSYHLNCIFKCSLSLVSSIVLLLHEDLNAQVSVNDT